MSLVLKKLEGGYNYGDVLLGGEIPGQQSLCLLARDEDSTFISTDPDPSGKNTDPDPTFDRNEEKNIFIC